MSDFRNALDHLRRPRLLMQAVRLCLADGRRPRPPRSALLADAAPAASRLARLMAAEAEAEAARLSGDAVYSPLEHIALLAALVFEMRLIAPAPPRAVV